MKILAALAALLLILAYHTGVAAEETCLAKGYSAEVCVGLRL